MSIDDLGYRLKKLRESRDLRKDNFDILWVSYNPAGQPLKPEALEKIISRVAKRAGAGRVYPHKLRHTGASMMLEAGMDRGNVQTLLGHETDMMTRHYTKTILNKVAIKQQETIHPLDDLLKRIKRSDR